MTNDYLALLSEQYPSIAQAAAEIVRLEAKLSLPKPTEHFLSDIHGEYEPFLHMLKNASGVIGAKISLVFSKTMSEADMRALATLIYYPRQKLEHVKETTENLGDWYKITLFRLCLLCRTVASKYTRSAVERALSASEFGSILDELIYSADERSEDKELYYRAAVDSIIRLSQADEVITALAGLIQRLAIGRLHILGDIFDRGPRADIILDRLLGYHSVDLQWGNHDIVWMGAASGSLACIANTITTSTKYCNFACLEDGYGINMRPLTVFALETYADDPCTCFIPKNPNRVDLSEHDVLYWAKIHKAIAIIQFKLEGQLLRAHPEFGMQNHLLLDKIDYTDGTVTADGKRYKMRDMNFPTVDPADPYRLTDDEQALMDGLAESFLHSEKLQRHIAFLFDCGSMYRVYNGNLLYHGCIPMNPDGSFYEAALGGERVSGRALLDMCELMVRAARSGDGDADFMWYLWCGIRSPLYGKNKMTSFERYFIDDAAAWEEIKDPYYRFIEQREYCEKILHEFGLFGEFTHIINGHVPVSIKKGESPIKAGGKLLVIDGGLSRAYQPKTGIAGYTLIFNSHGLHLSEHSPFMPASEAIRTDGDIHSTLSVVELAKKRMLVRDTDNGRMIADKIRALGELVDAYRSGAIKIP